MYNGAQDGRAGDVRPGQREGARARNVICQTRGSHGKPRIAQAGIHIYVCVYIYVDLCRFI